MCGIAAILYKNPIQSPAPIGRQLIAMLQAMRHRGADSTGVTVTGRTLDPEQLVVRLRAEGDTNPETLRRPIETLLAQLGGAVTDFRTSGQHLRLVVKHRGGAKRLADALTGIEGLELDSIGTVSVVIKDVGDAANLDRRHNVSAITGTHGIGHVRLATESQVDVAHSHPFWAYPFPDITVVHNGQLTNYRKLKRVYEGRGYHFQTHNDSELIAVYLADRLDRGLSLNDALAQSLSDLDGSYTYVVSTADSIGFAKEKWCFKPFVQMERSDVVALASEEVALRQVFPEEIDRIEPQENESMTWSIPV